MAKGLRSSVKKSNRSKLRARVFEPVEAARLERLHQKLLETAQQPKPEDPAKKNEMDVDSSEDANTANEASKEDEFSKEMDIDGTPAPSKRKQKDRKEMRKARKVRGRKPKNQISFPTTRGKGALKPFSESRVRKR